jgi:hypothetical protein
MTGAGAATGAGEPVSGGGIAGREFVEVCAVALTATVTASNRQQFSFINPRSNF